ncbi:MAG: hypothetical protein IH626_00595 [Rhodospirillales bacterium]|nr:hypothetical protein [Rhodospirillales bacterium]
MNRQDTASAAGDNGLIARWLASGGAVEAPAGGDAHGCIATADDGLQGGRYTTSPFSCADDGLQCSNITKGYGCIPPG